MQTSKLTDLGIVLTRAISNVQHYESRLSSVREVTTVHVPDVGNSLVFAYEQLRNASENIEDHLLFQRAVGRFYKRNVTFAVKNAPVGLGQELVIELTQAGYLKNDTVPETTVEKLDKLIAEYYAAYWNVKGAGVKSETAERWILGLLAVKSEQLFNSPIRTLSFAHFAHTHFLQLINVADYIIEGEHVSEDQQQTILYVAIHSALLKSDHSNIRSALLDSYKVPSESTEMFIQINKQFDKMASLKTTANLARVVGKNGAPLRVIRTAFFEQDTGELPDIRNYSKTLQIVDSQIDEERSKVKRNLRAGIVKSILFLLITKAIIGLLIEIPYDLLVEGAIEAVPLAVNLLFPPLFIAVSALTFKLPSRANKEALIAYVRTMLYQGTSKLPEVRPIKPAGKARLFNFVYVVMFLVAFYALASWLMVLHFNIVQGFIFFVFFCTASFLGYRLTLQIKELELVHASQGTLAAIRDFLYTPFILVGRKISYRFSRMNIIAQILDVMVELPLKTVIRLIRQWVIFLNNKKEEIL